MTLICILLGILLDRTSHILEQRRNFDWFDQYTHWLSGKLPGLLSQNPSSIIILLLPVMLLVALIQGWINTQLYGLLDAIFGLSIFAFCLGPLELNRLVNSYLQAREQGDEQTARENACAIMIGEASADPDQQTIEIIRGILHSANDRFFAVIFWFVLLGPFGALLYRLSSHTQYTNSNATLAKAARRLQAIMAWAPAHLAAMSYALTGNYEGARLEFFKKNKQDDLADCNYHTLITAGQGALKACDPGAEATCIHSAQALVQRSLIVWLAIISTLTLIGWMA
ncbi:MAG TPA: regulatory signaling modulator protein AmpE [Gammaproteobacteria bacterium]|nr:regulatory signaling modulator protein AmpE [Gammaproteobacteria bacterium]